MRNDIILSVWESDIHKESYVPLKKPYNRSCVRPPLFAYIVSSSEVSTDYSGTGNHVESTDTVLVLATFVK